LISDQLTSNPIKTNQVENKQSNRVRVNNKPGKKPENTPLLIVQLTPTIRPEISRLTAKKTHRQKRSDLS